MPRGSPFTVLCQNLHRAPTAATAVVADLHLHTTASDGVFPPTTIVALAKRAGLSALAVTDHDTLAGWPEADAAGRASGLRVVPGVECTATWRDRELHVLGLFVNPADEELRAALADVCVQRRARFLAFVAALAGGGVAFPPGLVEGYADRVTSLGRRHVAELLVSAGAVGTRGEAFARHLGAVLPQVAPTHFTPLAEVVRRLHAAGGLAVLAHPPHSFDEATFAELRTLGLDGVEAGHPSQYPERVAELRRVAATLGLHVSAGSDFHDDTTARIVGSHGLRRDDWASLESRRASGPR